MDTNQFVAIVAHAAMRQGVSTERLGLSINAATSKYAATSLFPAKLVDGQPEGTVELGSREPTGLVATLTHCLKIKRVLYCVPMSLDTFKVYW
jgi:hypothetical protein